MKQRAPAAKEKMDTEELLNFELDDESSLDLDSLGEDEEVIDLVDLVEKGEGEPLAEDRLEAAPEEELDLEGLDLELDSDEVPKKSSAMRESQGKEELDLSDLTMELGGEEELQRKVSEMPEEEGDVIEADLENLFAENEETVLIERKNIEETAAGDEAEITEADLDGFLDEGFGEEAVEAAVQAEGQAEGAISPEEELAALEGALKLEEFSVTADVVDLKDTQADEEKVPEPTVKEEILEIPSSTPEPVVQEIAGLSEEKLEMIISRVVEEVVERVARETMTDVAERLITEAIDALKRSMELSDSR
jgi:hypothetical protein